MNENEIVRIILAERIRLSAMMWAIVRDTHAVEDILQEVVLRALDERERFREEDHVVAWARTDARHRAIDYVRIREGRSRVLNNRVIDFLEEELDTRPAEALASRLDALRNCVQELPPKSREIVSLRYGGGMKAKEVATRLKRSADAIYQNLSRLHRQLRDCVEKRLVAEGLGETPASGAE